MESTLSGELLSACERIRNGETLPIHAITDLLRKIAACEIEEGGSYALENGILDYELNKCIAEFLGLQGVHLKKLDAYLELHSKQNSKEYESNKIVRMIRELTHAHFSKYHECVSENATVLIEQTIAGNTDKQMSLMPLRMREALGSKGELFSDEYIARLGLINIFFWSAFIVYDDFWDIDESARPEYLPIANLFAHEFISFFENKAEFGEDFVDIFKEYMAELYAANVWEITQCRIPVSESKLLIFKAFPGFGNYDCKFYPAAGHIFGPLSMLVTLGHKVESSDIQSLIEYFKNYLIAMQLNDDLHDWKEDLQRGHVSTVVHELLVEWVEENPETNSIDIEESLEELEQLFWFSILSRVCNKILEFTQRSRVALESISFIENKAPLEEFIIRNERSAQKALVEYDRSVEFIAAIEIST